MVKQGIKIFCRLKPLTSLSQPGAFEITEPDLEEDNYDISFHLPKNENDGYVNNKRELYKFKFNRVFAHTAKQDQIFENVSKPVIDNCLEGYNGTIFAYGQTGSGKTFTITGGPEKYSDRGIIPRSLSYLFDHFQKHPNYIFTTHISYLEIYNENGFDLLNPEHESSKLEDLPKVSLMEDSDGVIHLRKLSQHQANSVEEALNWLFLGDTNRTIAETPMNMASTRSHCIFSIHLSSREVGSDLIRKSKLHLVDLAGSERISKSNMKGNLLTEAKYINLSLHYLEQVIVSLSEKKSHIPYRNSMMTSLLRDSLGGNCMTTMIATCSVEKNNIDESISTCRFAQRVALIKNEAHLNEELDPKLMVQRLKCRVDELKQELALATGEERTDELTEEELDSCHKLVDQYLEDKDPDTKIQVSGDLRKIHFCFKLLKDKYWQNCQRSNSNKSNTLTSDSNLQVHRLGVESNLLNLDVDRLRQLVKQRDDEINVLVTMLKQEKQLSSNSEKSLFILREKYIQDTGSSVDLKSLTTTDRSSENLDSVSQNSIIRSEDNSGLLNSGSHQSIILAEEMRKAKLAKLSKARQEAFDSFRDRHPQNSVIGQQKDTLREKIVEAKELGRVVNSTRLEMNTLKGKMQQAMIAKAVDTEKISIDANIEEELLRKQLEDKKYIFKDSCSALRQLKEEIEHIQHLLEKTKVQLQKEFEEWWIDQVRANKKALIDSDSRPSTPSFGVSLYPDTLNSLDSKISMHSNNSSSDLIQSKGTLQHAKNNVDSKYEPIPYGITSSKTGYLTCTPQNNVGTSHSINLASNSNTTNAIVDNSRSFQLDFVTRSDNNVNIPEKVIKIGDREFEDDIKQFYRTKQQLLAKYNL